MYNRGMFFLCEVVLLVKLVLSIFVYGILKKFVIG